MRCIVVRCGAASCGMRQKRRNMPHDAATHCIRCRRTLSQCAAVWLSSMAWTGAMYAEVQKKQINNRSGNTGRGKGRGGGPPTRPPPAPPTASTSNAPQRDMYVIFSATFDGMIVTSPPVEVRSIMISVSVCMSVCLSVCPLVYHKNNTSKFHQIFCSC